MEAQAPATSSYRMIERPLLVTADGRAYEIICRSAADETRLNVIFYNPNLIGEDDADRKSRTFSMPESMACTIYLPAGYEIPTQSQYELAFDLGIPTRERKLRDYSPRSKPKRDTVASLKSDVDKLIASGATADELVKHILGGLL